MALRTTNVSHYCMAVSEGGSVVQEILPACVPHLAPPPPDLGHPLPWQRITPSPLPRPTARRCADVTLVSGFNVSRYTIYVFTHKALTASW